MKYFQRLPANRFLIEKRIGAGGMGVVYLARDPRLSRPVALKLSVEPPTDNVATRIEREAIAMAQLNHRPVITVHESGHWREHRFIAMAYMAGDTARQLRCRDAIPHPAHFADRDDSKLAASIKKHARSRHTRALRSPSKRATSAGPARTSFMFIDGRTPMRSLQSSYSRAIRGSRWPLGDKPWALLITTLVSLGTAHGAAHASGSTCEFSSVTGETSFQSNKTWYYRINPDGVQTQLGLSEDEFEYAIVYAAEVWNQQANGGTLVYLGETDETSSCDYSIVKVEPQCPNCVGKVDYTCNGAQFEMTIHRMKGSTPHTFQVGGNVSTSDEDMIFLAIHEFGHVLGLGDRYSTSTGGTFEPSVMGPFSAGNQNWQLHHYDIECVEANYGGMSGRRQLQGYRRWHVGGDIGAEASFTGSTPVTQGGPGITWHNGPAQWSVTAESESQVLWNNSSNLAGYNSVPFTYFYPDYWSAQPRTLVWQSYDRERDFVVYPTVREWENNNSGPSYQQYGEHRLRYVHSDDGFTDADGHSSTSTCTAMQSPTAEPTSPSTTTYGCTGTEYITTAHPMRLTWHEGVATDVALWVNHHRSAPNVSRPSQYNQMRISTGRAKNWKLIKYQSLGKQSAVTPGLVCDSDLATSQAASCMVAYVDVYNNVGDIDVLQFELSWSASAHRYEAVNIQQVSVSGLAPTASGITAWSHNGKFWLAYKAREPLFGNPVDLVYASTDQQTWTLETLHLGGPLGPEAISYHDGNNMLTSFR